MQQIHHNKIPKHLSVPLDLALNQPYHSIHIQETSILFPDNHKKNTKRIYISDHPILDKHIFNELFQQSEYSTQTHPSENKTQNKIQNKNKTQRKNNSKSPKKKKTIE